MNNLTWIEISRSALKHNCEQFRKALGKTQLMAVVKSNAYGHGYFEAATTIQPWVDSFGVASGTEALILRNIGIKKPILVLNYYSLDQVPALIEQKISLVVYNLDQARVISKVGQKAPVHIKVGTGLSRLGVYAKDSLNFIKQVRKLPNIEIVGLFSHFAASEDDPEYTMIQLTHFKKIIKNLEQNKIFVPIKHIACTASALAFPETQFDLARIGIGIYGMQSYKSINSRVQKLHPRFNLKTVMTWKAKVLAVKELPVGAYVGYGRTYKTLRKTRVAILPVGYFEGYDRKLSNLAEVLIGGKRCKVRGRIYMNLLSVDVTDVKNVKIGDEAVLIGAQGKEKIWADELGMIAGTINYEITARINPAIPRIVAR